MRGQESDGMQCEAQILTLWRKSLYATETEN